METALDAYSPPDLGASSGHPRLKRRPRVRNWLVLAVTVSSLTTPLIASAQDSNRDKEAPELIVATETGQVRGLSADGVDKFLAIPYAAPPTLMVEEIIAPRRVRSAPPRAAASPRP